MTYTCFNTIYPDPKSDDHLLTILLNICESELVERIGNFSFWLNDTELTCPNIYGTNCDLRNLETGNYYIKTRVEALDNKISGLLIESEKDARNRIKKLPWVSYYIEPGLNGIRKAIYYIKLLLSNQNGDLPIYLKNMKLSEYRFFMGVIWKMNSHLFEPNKNLYGIIDDESNTISGGHNKASGYRFSFNNYGDHNYKIYTEKPYLNHLNAITGILDQIAPNKYTAGPDEMDDFIRTGILRKEGKKYIPVKFDDIFLKRVHDYEWNIAPRKWLEEEK